MCKLVVLFRLPMLRDALRCGQRTQSSCGWNTARSAPVGRSLQSNSDRCWWRCSALSCESSSGMIQQNGCSSVGNIGTNVDYLGQVCHLCDVLFSFLDFALVA